VKESLNMVWIPIYPPAPAMASLCPNFTLRHRLAHKLVRTRQWAKAWKFNSHSPHRSIPIGCLEDGTIVNQLWDFHNKYAWWYFRAHSTIFHHAIKSMMISN
jgi:hypothetical protein